MELDNLHCTDKKIETIALNKPAIENYLGQLNPRWQYQIHEQALVADFLFNDYLQTVSFANALAWIAQQQNHHPKLIIEYKHCLVQYSTHSVSGISIKDFICAAKIDRLVDKN